MPDSYVLIGLVVIVGLIEAAVIGGLIRRKLQGKSAGSTDRPLKRR